MKEFDYRKYLKHNWLLQEAEQPATQDWEEEFREYAQEGGWDDETISQVIQVGNQHPEWIPDICGYGENPVADYEVFLEDPEAYMQSSVKDRAMDLSRRKYAFDLTGDRMFKEAGEANKAITSQLGLYQFVEDNCKTLDDILKLNPEELEEPISVAKEEGLSPREFIEEFVEEYGDWVDIAEMLGLTVDRRNLEEAVEAVVER